MGHRALGRSFTPGKLAQVVSHDAAGQRDRACRRGRPSRLARLLPRTVAGPVLPQARWFRTDGGPRERRARRQMRQSRPTGGRRLRRRLLLSVGLRADDRRAVRPSGHLDDLQRQRVQADQALPAASLPSRLASSSSTTRTTPLTPRPAARDGYRVETIEEFEAAFKQALALGKPVIIDAHITRWALPHYSPSPRGILAGIGEMIEERLRPQQTPNGIIAMGMASARSARRRSLATHRSCQHSCRRRALKAFLRCLQGGER